MPQIWMTYSELADQLKCSEGAAREQAVLNAWGRRRCSDGLTRVKLKPHLAEEYLAQAGANTTETRFGELMNIIATLEARLLRQHLVPDTSDIAIEVGSRTSEQPRRAVGA